jgi:hypothetical protein
MGVYGSGCRDGQVASAQEYDIGNVRSSSGLTSPCPERSKREDYRSVGQPSAGLAVIVESIFAHAHRSPEKPALYYGGRAVDYRAFASWIGQARAFLTQ